MGPFFLAIEGVIGVGKTTLAQLLQPRFGAELSLEAFEENPFLSDFYADRARYAFQTQMFFLLSRYRQQRGIGRTLAHGPLISDYIFAKDSLFAGMNLVGDELDIYHQLYHVLADRIPTPHLVVYLRASTDLLMLRIAMRDRAYERDMDRAYIDDLRLAYEQHFSNYTQTPLLTIDVDTLDYVQDPGALAYVEGQIRTALGIGVHQRALPEMAPGGPVERPPGEAPPSQAWEVMADFLATNEALGRLGSALARGKPSAALTEALESAMEGLTRVARAVKPDARPSSD